MKLLVGHDEDGNFFVIPINNREMVFNTIKKDFIDIFCDSDYSELDNIDSLDTDEYEDFIHTFVARGRMEIVEFNV